MLIGTKGRKTFFMNEKKNVIVLTFTMHISSF